MRRNLLLSVCFLMASVLFAGPVSKQQAQEMAAQFLSGKSVSHRTISASQMHVKTVMNAVDEAGQPYLYAVQPDNQHGYVIVSGDDRTERVLGYSPTGHIDPEAMPDNMKYYLGELAKEIAGMESDATGGQNSRRRAPVKKAISPLLTTHWDQHSPFNNLAPTVTKSNGETVHCVTGCVATAMAQVMNFYKYPNATIEEIPGYTSSSYGFKIDAIPAGTKIDWSKMADTYDKNSPAAQCDAVAKLMYLCGVSVRMDYGPSSSGASING